MKKFLALLTAMLFGVFFLVGCSTGTQGTNKDVDKQTTEASSDSASDTSVKDETNNQTDIRVIALKGPTAMGLVSFMNQVDTNMILDNQYQFEIAAAVDEVTPKIAQKKVDIAAIPANLASVLYNNTKGEVQVLAINTLGVLYIVESGNTITNVQDLAGKTIYASGKGATPEYALNFILSQNGIDPEKDVTIEWKSEHTECLAALTAQQNAIAMLPQPFVTTAQIKNEQIRIALDLTQEWERLGTSSSLITGVIVARREFVEQHPDAVETFLSHYKESVTYVNNNVEDAAALIEQYDIVPAAVAAKALPSCNITLITGSEMKEKLAGYLSVLIEQNPKSVGGALPGDDFYYGE